MKKFLIAALVAVSGSAQAADVVYNHVPEAPVAPAPVHVFSWEGAYVGAQVGYAHEKGKVTLGDVASPAFKDGGVGYGAFAGYNFLIGNGFVTGLEFGLGKNPTKLGQDGYGIKGGLNYDVSARLGYAFDNALVYGSVGYGVHNFDVNLPASVSGIFEKKGKSDGIVYGVGIDYALTDHVFTRVNYQYRDFRSNVVNTATKAKLGKIDFDQHFVGVGIGYKF